MPDPTRLTYFGVPGYVLLWLLTAVSFFLFGRRVVRYVLILAKARPEKRWDQIPKRVGLFLGQVLGQRRLLNEPAIGLRALPHLLELRLLRQFVLLEPDSWIAAVPPDSLRGRRRLDGHRRQRWRVLGLAALAVAAVRRYIFTPPRLERSGDATLILCLITVVLATSLRPRLPERSSTYGCGGPTWSRCWASWLICPTPSTCTCWLRRLACCSPRSNPPRCRRLPRARRGGRISRGGSCSTASPAPSAAAATGPAPASTAASRSPRRC